MKDILNNASKIMNSTAYTVNSATRVKRTVDSAKADVGNSRKNAKAEKKAKEQASWKCACGKKNETKFCVGCGKEKPCCPGCGADLTGAKFCGECGAAITE